MEAPPPPSRILSSGRGIFRRREVADTEFDLGHQVFESATSWRLRLTENSNVSLTFRSPFSKISWHFSASIPRLEDQFANNHIQRTAGHGTHGVELARPGQSPRSHLLFANIEDGGRLLRSSSDAVSHIGIQKAENIDIQRRKFNALAGKELRPGIEHGALCSHHVHLDFIAFAGDNLVVQITLSWSSKGGRDWAV